MGARHRLVSFYYLFNFNQLLIHFVFLFSFNRKPRTGLKFLQENKLLGLEATDVAHFLLTEERLDKTVVGDYLGDPDKFNKEVFI